MNLALLVLRSLAVIRATLLMEASQNASTSSMLDHRRTQFCNCYGSHAMGPMNHVLAPGWLLAT
jgi:hypothetical protein